MKITFLAHSGFFVELDSVCLLLDWWKGDLPALPGKPLLCFASHRHPDHFDPRIFTLDDGTRQARFLLGKDIRLSPRNREKWGVSSETAERCLTLEGGRTVEPLPGVTVEAFPSTDEGVAFLVTAEGRSVFHAGDLNWWHWEGEAPSWNLNMAANFKKYTAPLQGRLIDLAMLPLDPRPGRDGFRGPLCFLELMKIEKVLPMHQWEDYGFTARFLAEYPQFAEVILPVEHEGQTWEM